MSEGSEENLIQAWWDDEDVYALCQYFFNVEITPWQEQIVKVVAFDTHKRVVISCMTRYGKSFCVAMGVCLWIMHNPNRKIALIAPTNEKTTIIRNYIASMVSSNNHLLSLLDISKKGGDRIRKEVSRRRMTWKNGVEMRTLSAEGHGDQLMGFGADKVIADEECDIEFEVYRSKITRMLGESPDSSYVGIGNPNHRDNQMWQHWTDPNWFKIHIGYEIALKEGRISNAFVEEQRSTLTDIEFGILYRAEFPETSPDALIDWKWIDQAMKKQLIIQAPIVAGLDVAEQGNDVTVMTFGMKNKDTGQWAVVDIKSWGKTDLMPTVGKSADYIISNSVTKCNIDANGIGSGVYGRLEEQRVEGKLKCEINPFKGGLLPDTDSAQERFLNQKAEAYWHLRKLFEDGKISIPNHKTLISQLSKMKWEFTSNRKIRIRDPGEKEGDTAEKKSPDFADSLCYCVWEGGRISLSFAMLDLMPDKKPVGPKSLPGRT